MILQMEVQFTKMFLLKINKSIKAKSGIIFFLRLKQSEFTR